MWKPAVPARPRIVELRQYILRPGSGDEVIELFDREFLETQEATGMIVLGQFRDLDDSDRFVWFRGFADMRTREQALTAFYDGPVWARHRDQARATMIETSDVRLLRPVAADTGFAVDPAERPPVGAPAPGGLVIATLWRLPAERKAQDLLPVLRQVDPTPMAILTTEHAENTFPRLPVRTDTSVVVLLSSHPDGAPLAAQTAAFAKIPGFTAEPLQVLRLTPTGRSLVR